MIASRFINSKNKEKQLSYQAKNLAIMVEKRKAQCKANQQRNNNEIHPVLAIYAKACEKT